MPNIFDQLHKEGKQLYEAKKYREARKSFSEALLLSPDDPSMFCCGKILCSMNEFNMSQALADAEEFVGLCPNDFNAHHYLGLVHMSMENHEHALSALETVSKALIQDIVNKFPSRQTGSSSHKIRATPSSHQRMTMSLHKILSSLSAYHAAGEIKPYYFRCPWSHKHCR